MEAMVIHSWKRLVCPTMCIPSWIRSLQLRTRLGKEKGRRSRFQRPSSYLAPQVGLEPTTLRLTAECSAIELLRNKRPHIAASVNYVQGAKAFYSKWVPERQGDLIRYDPRKLALCTDLREYLQPNLSRRKMSA